MFSVLLLVFLMAGIGDDVCVCVYERYTKIKKIFSRDASKLNDKKNIE